MTMMQVLKQCGNDLSRENIMKQAANLKDLEIPMLLPGIKVNTSPTNSTRSGRCSWRGGTAKSWELFGDVIEGAGS